jgi:hypothetical protein
MKKMFLITAVMTLMSIFTLDAQMHPTAQYSGGSGYIATLGGNSINPYQKNAWLLFDSLIKVAEVMKDTAFAKEVINTKFQLVSMRTDTTDSLSIDVVLWDHYLAMAGGVDQFNDILKYALASNRIIKNYLGIMKPDLVLFDGSPFMEQKKWQDYHNRQQPIQYNQHGWLLQYPPAREQEFDLIQAVTKQGILKPEQMYGMEDTTVLQHQLKFLYSDSFNARYSDWLVSYRSLKGLLYAYLLYKEKKVKRIAIVIGSSHGMDYLDFSYLVPIRYNLLNKTSRTNQEVLKRD